MELSQILKCIADEPELPGDPPEGMKVALQTAIIENDIDLFSECLRITVRLTKQGIADRITKAFSGSQKDAPADA